MAGAGFYKNAGDGLTYLYAPNGAIAKTFTLEPGKKLTYAYPVNGWTWFETEAAACTAFGIPQSNVVNAAKALLAVYPEVPIAAALKASASLIADVPTFKPKG